MNELELATEIARIQMAISARVLQACETASAGVLSDVAADGPGDTIYAVDRVSEEAVVEAFGKLAHDVGGIVLVAEGLDDGHVVLPRGTLPENAALRIIVDPIDGTRGLMYQKRSAWVLTGVARNEGERTRLSDIDIAVQTEIPLLKQHLADQLVAIRGQGVRATRFDRIRNQESAFEPKPSTATTLLHGFATVSRFFPGARDVLSEIDEELTRTLLGPASPGKAQCFEDQYISSGGQIYELAMGHDRFVADLRPLLSPMLRGRGDPPLLCAHPYDLCTALVAAEVGVVLRSPDGSPLDCPLDVDTDVAWTGYANEALRERIEPVLCEVLERRGLLAKP